MSAARSSRDVAASEQQKKVIAGAVFGVLLVGVLYYELSGVFFDSAPASATAPVIVKEAPPAAAGKPVVSSPAAALDPTLHMQAMLVTEAVLYTGSGRNIFSTIAAETPGEKVPLPRVIGSIHPSGVTVPTYTAPSGPAPLPPIDLKFFGVATSPGGRRQAFLLHGDDVLLAGDGDIVLRKYHVIAVGANSVQVEDLTNNNKQTLPLLVNP